MGSMNDCAPWEWPELRDDDGDVIPIHTTFIQGSSDSHTGWGVITADDGEQFVVRFNWQVREGRAEVEWLDNPAWRVTTIDHDEEGIPVRYHVKRRHGTGYELGSFNE